MSHVFHMQVCRLGELVMPNLIYLWTHRPTDNLKVSLVKYFRLLMVCHHPNGARIEEEGAFALDWETWKSHLRKLYEAIYNDYQELRGRNKFATGVRDVDGTYRFNQEYVSLAADVFHQLFYEKNSVLEITQLSFLNTQPGGPAKKRRIESGWAILREIILNQASSTAAIAW